MSRSVTLAPIIAAIQSANELLGPNRIWTPSNDLQNIFIPDYYIPFQDKIDLIRDMMKTKTSWDSEDLNAFLQENNSALRFDPFSPPYFGMAAILDLLVKWLREGKEIEVVTDDNNKYPGARIDGPGIEFFTAPGHTNPIVKLYTKSEKDFVYLTVISQSPEGFELVNKAKELIRSKSTIRDYGAVVFPKVNFEEDVDISWLVDLKTTAANGDPCRIVKALQQTKLKMNEKGAHLRSDVAITALRACADIRPDYVIKEPFLVIFEREGFELPLSVIYVTEEHWKDPGTL